MILKNLKYAAFISLATASLGLSTAPLQAQSAMAATQSDAGVTLGTLTISGAFARATLPNAPVGGGFLTITNNGKEADKLVSITSPASADVQIHEMKMEGEVMKMRELSDGVDIPAGGTVALMPGGMHLMFMKPTKPFVVGQTVPLTLTFQNAGSITLELPVAGIAATAPAHSAM
jgi:copper(I)-binding protein